MPRDGGTAPAFHGQPAFQGNFASAPSRHAADPASLLASIRQRTEAELAPMAKTIDHDGFYPAELMRAFGRDGAFAGHLRQHSPLGQPDLGFAIEAMTAIASACMSTAFCAWCQDACGWYLEHSSNTALRARLQGDIASGAQLGGTGLSNPMKALAGMEKFALRATRVAGGYTVNGVLPWVSNLGPGHWFGTIMEDASNPSHRLMAMVECGQPGVQIQQNAHFIALEGTGTYSVGFRHAFIADENLLADPLGDITRRIRPGFTLLQTGMGFGVIEGCIVLMRQCDRTHRASNQYLPRQADDIEADMRAQLDRVLALARTPAYAAPDYLRDVLEARLAVSELTLAATQAAVLHGGARGYLEGSAIARRQREGNFVALITPSIRHLRQELAGMSRN